MSRAVTPKELMRRGIATFLEGIEAVTKRPGRATRGAVSRRVATAWHDDLLTGYGQDPARILSSLKTASTEHVVAARDLEFTSVCQDHLLPFQGRVHIAYAPSGRITGLSRLGRLVDCLSRRLQLQESLTREIVEAVQEHLTPAGAACVIEATHLCMALKGGHRGRSLITTAAFTGIYRSDASRRREVMAVLGVAASRGSRGRS
jgi:GTP cyclohydrolase I